MRRSTPTDNSRLNTEVVIPLNYLSNFWKSLYLYLINFEVALGLRRAKDFVISETPRTAAVSEDNRVKATATTSATFQINDAKLYVAVVTMSIKDNIKYLEHLKQGLRITVSQDKYMSEITTQPQNNNLDYMIDPTFRKNNRLLVLSFGNGDDDPTRNHFDEYTCH